MPFLLRTLRKNKFVRELQPAWVPADDVQADALKDLESGENQLSFWLLDDGLSDLDRLLAGLAANRDQLANLDFALIPLERIIELGIRVEENAGDCLDAEMSLLHRDLAQLTASQLAALAKTISLHGQLERKSKSQVRTLLLNSVAVGYLDIETMKEGIANKLA
ncbi:MAG: hypothetical protein KDE19_09000 [Caldilineaceae bacterium]|nr:hypothetical protein [Caldilineaceae bacterium]